MTMYRDDYITPTAEVVLSWKSISSYASNSEEVLEHWKQILHEVSTRRCAHVTHSLRWIGVELCDPKKYDGLTHVNIFLRYFELHIPYQ
jgi:hypothetical protein